MERSRWGMPFPPPRKPPFTPSCTEYHRLAHSSPPLPWLSPLWKSPFLLACCALRRAKHTGPLRPDIRRFYLTNCLNKLHQDGGPLPPKSLEPPETPSMGPMESETLWLHQSAKMYFFLTDGFFCKTGAANGKLWHGAIPKTNSYYFRSLTFVKHRKKNLLSRIVHPMPRLFCSCVDTVCMM